MKWVESWADHADCVMGSDLRVWEFSSQDMRQSWKRNHVKWYEIIWDRNEMDWNGLESYEIDKLFGWKKKSIWFHLYLETRFALLRVPQYHLRKQPVGWGGARAEGQQNVLQQIWHLDMSDDDDDVYECDYCFGFVVMGKFMPFTGRAARFSCCICGLCSAACPWFWGHLFLRVNELN